MSKQNSLSELFDLLEPAAERRVSQAQFLFLLGTDTQFTPKPTIPERTYERGETLSYSAMALVTLLNETAVTEPRVGSLSYSSPSVDVIDGPDWRGSNVGPLIAQGLFLALRAAATGKTTLQITAHSRGAVEAILIMHELKRIKTALRDTPEKTLRDILLDSPCPYTKAALNTIFPQSVDQDTLDNRNSLSQKLDALQLNAFLIDPVPGTVCLPWTNVGLPGFTWYDDRFSLPLPCDHYELIICRDERSNFFFPLVYQNYNIIPSHHGTASGNPYAHGSVDLPVELQNLNTQTVQDLVLLKLFYFIEHRTHPIENPIEPLHGGAAPLDQQLSAYLLVDARTKKQLIIDKYFEVNRADEAFLFFRTTTYAGPVSQIDGHRWVHNHARATSSMGPMTSNMHGHIVNPEHASLILDLHLDIFDPDMAPSDVIPKITQKFNEISRADPQQSDLSAILCAPQIQETFRDSLSILVESIGQKYLRNNLTSDEKQRLLTVISDLLATLPAEEEGEVVADWEVLGPVAPMPAADSPQGPPVELKKAFLLGCKQDIKKSIQTIIESHKVATLNIGGKISGNIDSLCVTDNNDHAEIKQLLLAIQAYYHQSKGLVTAYPLLKELIRPLPLEDDRALDSLNEDLINKTAHLLKAKSYSLRQLPTDLDEELSILISTKAIEMGALSAEAELAQELAQKEAEKKRMEDFKIFLARTYKEKACAYSEDVSLRRIISQLIKLTKDYSNELLIEAQQHVPNVESDTKGELPDLPASNANSTYNKIKTKFNIVNQLHKQLNNNQISLTARIESFTAAIKTHDNELKSDHNPGWIQYVKTALAIIATILIIPAIIYYTYNGKSLFFNQKNPGEEYIEKADEVCKKPDAS